MRNVIIGLLVLVCVLGCNPEQTDEKPTTSEKQTVPNEKWVKKKAVVTAYVPRSESYGKFNDGKTSLGDDATILDGVAVDPDRIPYRSKIFIPGVGIREADDTGSAMRNNDRLHIDLRVRDKETAYEWGRKEMNVWIKVD